MRPEQSIDPPMPELAVTDLTGVQAHASSWRNCRSGTCIQPWQLAHRLGSVPRAADAAQLLVAVLCLAAHALIWAAPVQAGSPAGFNVLVLRFGQEQASQIAALKVPVPGGDEPYMSAEDWHLRWAPKPDASGRPQLAVASSSSPKRILTGAAHRELTGVGCTLVYLRCDGWAHWAPDGMVQRLPSVRQHFVPYSQICNLLGDAVPLHCMNSKPVKRLFRDVEAASTALLQVPTLNVQALLWVLQRLRLNLPCRR